MSHNLVMGIPKKRVRSADPYNGREVIVLEENQGTHAFSKVTLSIELCNRLNLPEDKAYIALAVYTDEQQNPIMVHIVPGSESDPDSFRLTKRNGSKPRSVSDKTLHNFLSSFLLGITESLSADQQLAFDLLEGDNRPADLNFDWVLRLKRVDLKKEPSSLSNQLDSKPSVSSTEEAPAKTEKDWLFDEEAEEIESFL